MDLRWKLAQQGFESAVYPLSHTRMSVYEFTCVMFANAWQCMYVGMCVSVCVCVNVCVFVLFVFFFFGCCYFLDECM